MKNTCKIISIILLSFSLLFISACGATENNKKSTSSGGDYEKVLKIKGGPDAYSVFLDDAEEWTKLDGREKITLIDKSISICESMDPADSFEVSGFYKNEKNMVFFWESTNPSNYYEQMKGEKVKIEE